MTKEDFLAWVAQREERYEFAGGRAVMMVRTTWNHGLVAGNLFLGLKSRLNRQQYDAIPEGFAVHIGNTVRFPDVIVHPVPMHARALQAIAPIMIAEVLSPGTLHIDFGDKRSEYLSLPTLQAYVILSPDEPQIWLWQRQGVDFPSEPELIEGTDKQLGLAAFAFEIPLAEIYQGVSQNVTGGQP
jgi:Uma2 family endonuclease